MRWSAYRVILLYLACVVSQAYQPWECPTELLEQERVDCYPESGASEANCIARGCTWCETYSHGVPWCFDNTKPGFDGTCKSHVSPKDRVDCWPKAEPDNAKCVASGCVWCPLKGYNSCFYDDNPVTDSPTTYSSVTYDPVTTAPTTAPNPTYAPGCASKLAPKDRVDCFPGPGSSEQACISIGCIWCEDTTPGLNVPWCSYPNNGGGGGGGGDDGGGGDGSCPTDIPEKNRRDCFPDGGATSGACVDRGCIWCDSSTGDVPWCFFNFTGQGSDPAMDVFRIDCMPEGGFDTDECRNRGCEFMGTDVPNAPICYFPDDRGYDMIGDPIVTTMGYQVNLEKRGSDTLYGGDAQYLTLLVEFQTDGRLHMKFTDANAARFEVPLTIDAPTVPAANPLYDVGFGNYPVFNFNVTRRSTGEVIFDTSIGGFVFSDQFLQIATRLPANSKVYGFGEHEHHSFKHDLNWQTMGMYARDQPPTDTGNLYGVHPFYMAVEEDFNAHAVLFLNSAAQDVTLSPAPYLLYRTIGGILDIYVFLGPTPENVVQQYTDAIGRPYMPPYWALGFQLCRYGYNSLATVKDTVSRMRAYNIPQDVQYGDIDYMIEQRDFTYDPVTYDGLPNYVTELQSMGMHYIIILDPFIGNDLPPGTYPPYDEGTAADVWVKNSDCKTPAIGKVWPPKNSVFPDFHKPATTTWWEKQCVDFHKVINYDGLWIDMNEPANFVTGSISGCDQNTINYPPFLPKIFGGQLADKTLCPDACTHIGNHYDVHNLYGWGQCLPSLIAARSATGKRSIVISRSTFVGAGKYAGHWLGDNASQWSHLRYSIIGLLEFNLFGIPYIGADICGFNGNADEELCQRWMQLGAFYTFSRNHNGIGYQEQDPASFSDEMARVSREILNVRYTLLPYLYTLFHEAHTKGSTVIRPVMHEFISDPVTHTIDTQFLWGPALLISPVLDQGATTVDAYFPDSRWYDYYTGAEIPSSNRKKAVTLNAPLDYIPLHVRGGHIIATQDPAWNTELSRQNPFGLIVALGDADQATGSLFWDDGDSVDTYENGQYYLADVVCSKGVLTGTVTNTGGSVTNGLQWGTIRVLGVKSASSVTVGGANHPSYNFDSSLKVLTISNIKQSLTSTLKITWT